MLIFDGAGIIPSGVAGTIDMNKGRFYRTMRPSFLQRAFLAGLAVLLVHRAASGDAHAADTEHLYLIREGGLYGYIDKTGTVVVEPKYQVAWDFSEGLGYVCEMGRYGSEGFIGADGEWAFRFPQRRQWEIVDSFHDGLAMIVTPSARLGFIDRSGKVAIPAELTYAEPFSEGTCLTKREKKSSDDPLVKAITLGMEQGLIGKNGELLFQPDFGGNDAYKGCERVFMDGMWCYELPDGRMVYPVIEEVSGVLRDGLARVWNQKDDIKGRFGFVDQKGKIVIPLTFERAEDFFEGLAKVYRDGKWGFIDKRGKVVIDYQFEDVARFSNGRARFVEKGQYGFIDTDGRVAVEPRYETAYDFTDGLAAVSVGGKWGFIGQDGKMVIKPRFDSVREFDHGLAYVCEGTRVGYVDKRGEFVYVYDTVFAK